MIQKHHRQRIGLLPRRTAGAPHTYTSRPQAAATLGLPVGVDLLFEKLELPRFAKEMGFIGQNTVEQLSQFAPVLILRGVLVVRMKGFQPQFAYTTSEPRFQESFLGRAQADAGLTVDQLSVQTEFPIGNGFHRGVGTRSAERAPANF